jgi:GDP-L-fucose synthase
MIQDEVLQAFQGRDVIVTGGTGMIGRQVVGLLCDAGASVRVVSLDRVCAHEKAEHLFGDLTDYDFCKQVTKDAEYVCHLAGIKTSAKVSATQLASHFVPTLMLNTNVLEACRSNNVRKVVYTSSIGAYANGEILKEREPGSFDDAPMDFAGWAKRMGELQIHAYRVQYGIDSYSIVRPSNAYGPGDNFDPETAMVVGSLMGRILNGEDPVLVWGDGSASRDLVFSRDVAEGIILAAYHGTRGRYVNLGSGKGHTIRELVETLNGFIDFKYEFDASKPSGYPKRVMDISLAREMIGYEPTTTLEDGLRETWEWYRSHRQEHLKRKNYFEATEDGG